MFEFGEKHMSQEFKASITFYYENGKQFSFEDYTYPISREKHLLTTGEQCLSISLKKLTEYYNFDTKEYKSQPNIQFKIELFRECILDPKKSDEVVIKAENVESALDSEEDG